MPSLLQHTQKVSIQNPCLGECLRSTTIEKPSKCCLPLRGTQPGGHSNSMVVSRAKSQEDWKASRMSHLLKEVEQPDLVQYGLIPEFVGRFPVICSLQVPPPPFPLPSTISVWWLRSTVFEKVRSSLQQFASFDRLKVTVGNVPLRSSNLKRIVFVARMGLHGPTISILQYPTSL
jgi:hypothetical protein